MHHDVELMLNRSLMLCGAGGDRILAGLLAAEFSAPKLAGHRGQPPEFGSE